MSPPTRTRIGFSTNHTYFEVIQSDLKVDPNLCPTLFSISGGVRFSLRLLWSLYFHFFVTMWIPVSLDFISTFVRFQGNALYGPMDITRPPRRLHGATLRLRLRPGTL